ncbi:MAG TPA: lysylphosphatidylglycerol synthase transmembrane domain-containing protein [Acidimicrobiales bacterium]
MQSEPGRPLWRRLLLPVVTVIGLILVAPVLIDVYSSVGDITNLGVGWQLAMIAATVAQLTAFWELHRIVMRTDRWFDVAVPHLVGNAASHLAPGGGPVGAGIQTRMMTTAGFSVARVVTALGAITIVSSVANFVVLPLFVLAASVVGSDVDAHLVAAMWFGALLLAVALVLAVVVILRDGPWRRLSHVLSWAYGRMRRETNALDLERRLIGERDLIRRALRERAAVASIAVVASALGDFAVLYFALRAVGAHVSLGAALAAFIVSNVAGLIPITPGGLGFVEAGMAGVLTLAGATSAQADLAVVAYRLVATWLPCAAGAVSLFWFQRRHRNRRLREMLAPLSPV